MKKFNIIDELVAKGYEDDVVVYEGAFARENHTLTKTYKADQRVNDFGILNRDFSVEVNVTTYDDGAVYVWAMYSNGKTKQYTTEKRAYNAIAETVHYNGFEI